MVNEYIAFETPDTKVKLKSVKLKNHGMFGYCLDITYIVDSPFSTEEINIPCVKLPISEKRFAIREDQGAFLNRFYADIGFDECVLCEEFGKPPYTIKTIQEKTKEMTLEEIEKKLGHKVKIVSDKK